jgi:hypothetical protein
MAMKIEMTFQQAVKKASQKLTKVQRNQLPFAIANALTQTAKGLVKEEQKEMRRDFHRPTKWTLNSSFYLPASKKDKVPTATFGLRQFATKSVPADRYLNPNIFGGRRNEKSSEKRLRQSGILPSGYLTAPGRDARVLQNGNMARGEITKLLAAVGSLGGDSSTSSSRRRNKNVRGYYVAYKGGKAVGIRHRAKGSDSMKILNFIRSPNYKKRYDYYETANRYVKRTAVPNFRKALNFALATAK